jgi:hypothetical protein
VRFATRRGGLETRPRFRIGAPYALLAAATAGATSHLALDLVSGARIRVGWPLVDQRVSLPLVAMADPWLIGICVAGLFALWPGRMRLRTVARAILVAAAVFLAFKGARLHRALRLSPLATTVLPAVEAQWGSLTHWSVFERTPTSVRAWLVTSRDRPAVVRLSEPLGPDTPLVKASRSLDTVHNFLSVHEFSFPIERRAADGGTEVLWSDLRYCWREDDGSTRCGVWAGGVFGADGRSLRQLVKIGAIVQTRQAP